MAVIGCWPLSDTNLGFRLSRLAATVPHDARPFSHCPGRRRIFSTRSTDDTRVGGRLVPRRQYGCGARLRNERCRHQFHSPALRSRLRGLKLQHALSDLPVRRQRLQLLP
jgi:hypothetical protein